MGRTRLLLLGTAIALAAATPGGAVEDASLLVFDLDSDAAVVEEHTAHLLWNLSTDNIDTATYPTLTGWNSLYLTVPETTAASFAVDLEAGSVNGVIAETWKCEGDCAASDGSRSWTTTRDTGYTATVVDGQLAPDGPGWSIEGTATIKYHAKITAEEDASDCNGVECYVCLDRLCLVNETMTAAADIEGWIDGDTLSLAFEDQLAPDAGQMDFTGMRETQFFMSRFSITISGTEPAAAQDVEPPPDDQTSPDVEGKPPAPEIAGDQPVADDQPVAGGSATEIDDEEEVGDEASDEVAAEPDEPAEALAVDDDPDAGGRIGVLVAAIIIMVLLFGVAFLLKVRPNITDGMLPPKPTPAVDPMFDPKTLSADPGDSPPYDDALDPPPPPIPAAWGEVTQFKRAPDEIGAGPAYMLQSTDGKSWVEGTKGTQVIAYQEGTFVEVVGRAGDSVKVQVGNDAPIWINDKNLKYLRR
ncbi:MAG: hypothetical protein QNJ89_14265 [Acidimicrobiia bacterium]|nr:hypothetical protein [Acidimicrobiia bacterium]